MPLGPLRDACAQPAPKSRFVVPGLSRTKIKIKIDGNSNGNGTVNAGLLEGCVSSRNFKAEHQSLWEKLELCDSSDGGGSVKNV